MAEIKIEKKGGMGILAWLIPLLLILLLLWWLFGRGRDDVSTGGDVIPTPAPAVVGDADTAITDVMVIVAVPDRMSLIGRRVQFASVPVQAVVGDETFWVGPSTAQRLFVALDPRPATRPPEESLPKVRAGQMVTVTGVLRQVPADLAEMRTRWKMDATTSEALTAGQVYLAANQVTITQRP